MIDRMKRVMGGLVRGVLGWASLLAIPLGIGVGLAGWKTLGALLVLGGTLAYFLVDPLLTVLDLMPRKDSRGRSHPPG